MDSRRNFVGKVAYGLAGTLAAVRKAVADEGGKAESVENVYFTSFVIQ